MFMLDTNVASAAIKGIASVDRRLLSLDADDWCISSITRSEMRFGLAKHPEATKLRQRVEAFLEYANSLAWDDHAAERHAMIRANLRRESNSIGDFDEMIAAHALSLGAVLVTENLRHFKRVKGLKLENWIER